MLVWNVCSNKKPKEVISHFRILQTLNNRFNLCFHSVILPFTLLTLLLINVLSNYASVRLHGEVKFPGSLGFPLTSMATLLIVLDTLPTSYTIYYASEKLIRTTREKCKSNGYTHKFLNSCRPLGVQVGYYFVIKQITVMTFLGIIVENAITLLLTF